MIQRQGTPTIFEGTGSNSPVIPVPAGVATNEVLVAVATVSRTSTSQTFSTPPAGWVLVGQARDTDASSLMTAMFLHVVTNAGSEPASYTFASNAASNRAFGAMARYSGVDTTTPQDVAAAVVAFAAGTATTIPVTGVTTVTAGAMLVAAAGYNAVTAFTSGAPGTMTLINGSTGTGRSTCWADELAAAAGATGTRTFTKPSTTSQRSGIMLALRPAATTSNGQGAATGTVQWDGAASGPITELLAWDNFNRTGSTPGVAPSGQTWTVHAGAFDTDGSTIGETNGADASFVTVDVGTANCLAESRFYGLGTNKAGMVMARFTDVNSYYCATVWTDRTIRLDRGQGPTTLVTLGTSPYLYTDGDVLSLQAREVSGQTQLTVWVNAVPVITYTDTTAGRPAGTRVGYRHAAAGAQLFRYDDFQVKAAGSVPARYTTTPTPWLTAVNGRATRAARVLWVGDSIFEGWGASTRPARPGVKFLGDVRTAYPVSGVPGGEGYVPARYAHSQTWVNSWVKSGSSTDNNAYGPGKRALIFTTTGSATLTVTGTDMDLYYRGGGGSFTWRVDSGSTTTVNTGAGANGVESRRARIPLGTSGSHTVQVAWVSGTVTFEGGMVFDGDTGSGFTLLDHTHSGFYSDQLGDSGFSSAAPFIIEFAPDLVVFELVGANDYLWAYSTPAVCLANVQTSINRYRTMLPQQPQLLVVIPRITSGPNTGSRTWAEYMDPIVAWCTAEGIPVLDLRPLTAVTLGDGVHPNDAGHDAMAAAVFGALPAASAPTGTATGAVTWAGDATGSRPAGGTAAGAVEFAGGAAGSRPAGGTAAGGVTWVGSAAGSRPAGGTAAGAVDFAGGAAGSRPAGGTAAGAVGWVGSAAGAAAYGGPASGTVTWVGTANGPVLATPAALVNTMSTALQAGWWLSGPAGSARMAVSTSPALTSPVYSTAATPVAGSYAVACTVTGLTPGTQYYIGLEVDGTLLASGRVQGRTLTASRPAPGTTWRFGSGSCQNTGSVRDVFNQIAAEDYEFFVHMGDRHYADTSVEESWRAAHKTSITSTTFQALVKSTPMTWTPDNHDWGGNRSWRDTPVGVFAYSAITETMQGYQQPGAFYRTYAHRGVRFIEIDRWSQRDKDSTGTSTDGDASAPKANDDPTKVMLGATQEAWLLDLLANATEALIVIFSGFPLTSARLGPYQVETTRIRNYIAGLPANQRAKIIALGGDSHDIRACTGAAAIALWGIPTLNASPFQQTGGPFDVTGWDIGQVDVDYNYGYWNRCTVTDNGDAMTFRWDAMSSNGTTSLLNWTTTLATSTVPMVGSGSMGVTGQKSSAPAVPMAGAGSMGVSPQTTPTAAVAMAGAGTMGVAAQKSVAAAVPMAGSGALAVTAQRSVGATVTMSGAGSLTLTGRQNQSATVPMSGAGTMAVSADGSKTATVTMSGAGSLAVAAQRSVPAAVAMSGAGVLSVSVQGSATAVVPMVGAGTLSVAALDTVPSTAVMAGTGLLSVAAGHTVPALVTMAGAGALSVTVSGSQVATVPMSGAGALAVGAELVHSAGVPMAGAGVLLVTASRSAVGAVPMAGVGTLLLGTTTVDPGLFLSMAGSGQMLVTGTGAHSGMIVLAGVGTLSVFGLVTDPTAGPLVPVEIRLFRKSRNGQSGPGGQIRLWRRRR